MKELEQLKAIVTDAEKSTVSQMLALIERVEVALAQQQEPVARIAELEETVCQLNHALRDATEAPTFMGEPVIVEPIARIKGVDEYGPMLEWYTHWNKFPVGTKFYTTPPQRKEPEQEPVAWINIKRDMTYLHGPYNADDLPLYTKPPQRKPLTATQIKKAMMDAKLHFCGEVDVLLTRAIEAAHGIKE